MEFGNRLYELRKQKGLSQEELASCLDVTRQTVSKWELGDSTPDMDKLVLLGELFEISLDELVLGKVPVTTKLDELGASIMTTENKQKAKKGLKESASSPGQYSQWMRFLCSYTSFFGAFPSNSFRRDPRG